MDKSDAKKHHLVTKTLLPESSCQLLIQVQLSLLFSFVPCSEKIHSAVTEMASLFPKVSSPY